MVGWSILQQNDYELSLVKFTQVLDRVFAAHSDLIVSDLTWVEAHQKTLVNDLLRVMGLSFSYLDGAQSLSSLFDSVGAKHYEVLVYSHYSNLLLDKELFTNAIDVYRAFIKRHPMNLWVPSYHINVIETLAKAKFNTTINDDTVRFVKSYSLVTTFLYHDLVHQA